MSNEELFAAIHKSKKRLNIRDESENLSPYGSTNSLVKMTIGNKNDWGTELQKSPAVSDSKIVNSLQLFLNVEILNGGLTTKYSNI